jgi:hypothetical protein
VVTWVGLCPELFLRGWVGSRRDLTLAVDCAVRLTIFSSLVRLTFFLTSGLLVRGDGLVRLVFFLTSGLSIRGDGLVRLTFCLASGLLIRGDGVVRFLVPLADKSLRLMTSCRSGLRSVLR